MKQANEMTAHSMLAGTFTWFEKFKCTAAQKRTLQRRVIEKLVNLKKHMLSILSGLCIGGLFLAGSYLFFVQLAEYGW